MIFSRQFCILWHLFSQLQQGHLSDLFPEHVVHHLLQGLVRETSTNKVDRLRDVVHTGLYRGATHEHEYTLRLDHIIRTHGINTTIIGIFPSRCVPHTSSGIHICRAHAVLQRRVLDVFCILWFTKTSRTVWIRIPTRRLHGRSIFLVRFRC